jgi:hypothetical protein
MSTIYHNKYDVMAAVQLLRILYMHSEAVAAGGNWKRVRGGGLPISLNPPAGFGKLHDAIL